MTRPRPPLLALSALIVFGTVAVVLRNLGAEDGELRFGFEQVIHARIPWLVLGLLWGGFGLGIAAVVRRGSVPRFLVVGLELLPVAVVSWHVVFSFLPSHVLALEVGDAFPAYALKDHDGVLRDVPPSAEGAPALYIFYRGDW